tara:strand:- start:808 stop:1371 length:564 start_codon:yes stop_codon:yes gene_type:complete
MGINERQNKILDFVKHHHDGQVRKYTNEPYWHHLINVANSISVFNIEFGVEIALCHDLFEDTDCTSRELDELLSGLGYNEEDSQFICNRVQDLTDVFTKEEYPYLNRKARKNLEAIRLSETHEVAQSVKYCDLLDNTASICMHDKKFAKVYLSEKRDILDKMIYGNTQLFAICFLDLKRRFNELNYE